MKDNLANFMEQIAKDIKLRFSNLRYDVNEAMIEFAVNDVLTNSPISWGEDHYTHEDIVIAVDNTCEHFKM